MKETLKVASRGSTTKGENKRMRKNGLIPAVIYGEKNNTNISVDHKAVLTALKKGVKKFTLTIDDKNELEVITKEVQKHPLKLETLTHIDFMPILDNKEITAKINIDVINADKNTNIKTGGTVTTTLRSIEVRCLPKDMPDSIPVDIADLEMGHTLQLSDIPLPEGLRLAKQLTKNNNQSVVTIIPPKVKAAATTE